jgi:fructokinase
VTSCGLRPVRMPQRVNNCGIGPRHAACGIGPRHQASASARGMRHAASGLGIRPGIRQDCCMGRITVIGEAVADAFVEPSAGRTLTLRVHPGGGPANIAVGLARLGTPTRFLGRFSGGVFGTLLREHLAASGVDLSAAVPAAQPATLAVAALDAAGQASYEFYVDGTADWQWTEAELLTGLDGADGADAVHTGSLALVIDPGGHAIEQALDRIRPHATISIDPNVRPSIVAPEVYADRLPRWFALADIFRLSTDDLEYLVPGASIADACDRWHDLGVRLVVVTRGGDGAVASLGGERVSVPAVAVTTVDTVGAGDAFTAGLLHRLHAARRLGGRLDGLTLDEVADAIEFGALVAARTCAVPGADPPWAATLG